MDRLMTIAEVAKELKIPESTARYYRDNFMDFIPYVGEGRKKRYRPETVDVLRFIADGFKRKLTASEIEDGLGEMFPQNMDDEQVTARSKAVVQQQSESDATPSDLQLQNVLEQVNMTMQVMTDQQKEITELRDKLEQLEEKQARSESAATTEISKKQKWWQRLFKKEKKPSSKD